MTELGFIILRHVNNERTNQYWMHCYDCIRKYYPENKILIVDDNSKYSFITPKKLYNTLIVQSEYPGRGELLPYYYYIRHKLFDRAVILHDSVFINRYMDFNVDTYKIMWTFEHNWDQIEDETRMIDLFQNEHLKIFYEQKSLWTGCFGGMSVISHDYLMRIHQKYNLDKLVDVVLNRYNRCSFERVIACLLQTHDSSDSVLGDIHEYCTRRITFEQKHLYEHLPLIKVWTGR